VLLGEGQTAQVLRNLCHQLYDRTEPRQEWNEVCRSIESLFGAQLQPPEFIKERGEITMAYKDPEGSQLDLSSAGRGLQQTLLLTRQSSTAIFSISLSARQHLANR